MKAVVKSKAEPGLWLEEVPVPEVGDDDVLVRVLKTSICGTDVHIYNWDAWSQKTIPVPMVLATFNPNTMKATKLKNAAHSTAYCGRSTRVETMVAIELAASCNPLRKSNSSATAINPTSIGRPSVAST